MKSILLLLMLFSFISAKDYPIYRNGVLLFFGPDSLLPNSGSLCRALKAANAEITQPECREEGRFARNVKLKIYREWLAKNTVDHVKLEDLAARDAEVKAFFEQNQWNHILLIYPVGQEVKMALFWGGQPYPKEIKAYPLSDRQPIEYHISQRFFVGPTERKISERERESQQKEADAYYSEKIIYDTYFTLGTQWISALGDHSQSAFREFRFNQSQDSSSQYDWTETHSQGFSLSAGKGYGGMFYIGIFGAWSRFDTKYDTTHLRIKEWYYDRYDLGLETYIGKTFPLPYEFDLFPFVYANFSYTWMSETFSQELPQNGADLRVKLPTVKGASIALGFRLLYQSSHGIEAALGLSHRGIVAKEAFNPDPQEEIGGTTNEYWFGLKYWLNFRFLE